MTGTQDVSLVLSEPQGSTWEKLRFLGRATHLGVNLELFDTGHLGLAVVLPGRLFHLT